MIYADGFYKLDGNELLYAPNFVINQNFELRKDSKDNYTYPLDGWSWFDNVVDACSAFGINIPIDDTQN